MFDEEEGVRAIIALQKMTGVDEPEEVARKSWREFNKSDKLLTENCYKMFIKKEVM